MTTRSVPNGPVCPMIQIPTCARVLLTAVANPDVANLSDNETPLHIASAHGDESMDLAKEHGHTRLFDVLGLGDRLCLATRKAEVRTVNRIVEAGASFNGYTEVVRLLIEKGVNLDARDGDGKGADVKARTNKGVTAMQIADSSNYAGITRILINGGANMDKIKNVGKHSPPAFVNKTGWKK
ncbi:putative ankyrin repeat-containing domain-containing protein [Helianthus anomalus]